MVCVGWILDAGQCGTASSLRKTTVSPSLIEISAGTKWSRCMLIVWTVVDALCAKAGAAGRKPAMSAAARKKRYRCMSVARVAQAHQLYHLAIACISHQIFKVRADTFSMAENDILLCDMDHERPAVAQV